MEGVWCEGDVGILACCSCWRGGGGVCLWVLRLVIGALEETAGDVGDESLDLVYLR